MKLINIAILMLSISISHAAQQNNRPDSESSTNNAVLKSYVDLSY